MKLLSLIGIAASAQALATADKRAPDQHAFENPPSSLHSSSSHRIPTPYESAVLGRRILALQPLGTLATVFPADEESSNNDDVGSRENRPSGLGGMPHGLMEYVADCEGEGNPTFLAINVETTFKNVRDGSNISLSQAWSPRYLPDKRIKSAGSWASWLDWLVGGVQRPEEKETDGGSTTKYSAANLPRYSLLGYIEKIGAEEAAAAGLASCFVKKHPDAKYWLPGNQIHEAEWVRLVVTQVYWIGGFGDRAYIGWIDPTDWKSVSQAEWQGLELPGEEPGWDEWSVHEL